MKNKIAFGRHYELPLNDDSANWFLKIMTAIAVFLFSVALSGYFAIHSMTDGWNQDITGSLTVQIMPESQVDAEANTMTLNKVINFFETMPQVQKVTLISDAQMQKIMSPWLGSNVEVESLPLPKILDVKIASDDFDYQKAADGLSDITANASIDNHRIWLGKLLKFTSSLQFLSLTVLFMLLIVSAFSIFYAAKTSLGIHANIIEILHIMGALDDYIAKQYARRSFWIGLFSGTAGLLLSLLALHFIRKFSLSLDIGLMGNTSLQLSNWLLIFSLPLWAALLSMLTAYWTVRKTLGKMM